MSVRSVKDKIASAGTQVNVTEGGAIVAEAKKNGVTAGEREAVKDLFATGNLTAAAKVEPTAMRGTVGGQIP